MTTERIEVIEDILRELSREAFGHCRVCGERDGHDRDCPYLKLPPKATPLALKDFGSLQEWSIANKDVAEAESALLSALRGECEHWPDDDGDGCELCGSWLCEGCDRWAR